MAESKQIVVEVSYFNVTTTVAKTISQLDKGLEDLLSTIRSTETDIDDAECVIGLDIERHYYQVGSKNNVAEKVAVLKLCFNETCLIIQLLHINEPLCSLHEFLQRQELTFVGVKIGSCLDALNRDYGIKCRNGVDLGEIVAASLKSGKYKAYGLRALVDRQKFDWNSENLLDSPLGGWGAPTLTRRHIEGATCGAFLCYTLAAHYTRAS